MTTLAETRSLRFHAGAFAGLSALLTFVWLLTPHGEFWPKHALVPLALALGVHAWLLLFETRPDIVERAGGSRPLAVHAGISAALWTYLVWIWAMTPGYFWPAWALLGLAAALGVHWAIVRERHPKPERVV
jgi:hypothetical protein